jgi:hypothetical protein
MNVTRPTIEPPTHKESQVRQHLLDLGSTPETVYETLRDLTITGGHGAANCPVANYLKSLGWPDVQVTKSIVFLGTDLVEYVVLPLPVHKLIVRFDAGQYPDLRSEGNLS